MIMYRPDDRVYQNVGCGGGVVGWWGGVRWWGAVVGCSGGVGWWGG